MSEHPDVPLAADSRPGEAAIDESDDYSLFDETGDAEVDLSSATFSRHRVVAVMVAHDGEPWVGRALDAVAAQARPVDRLYVVDTGSTDGTAALLADVVGPGVETLPRTTGFGAAVAHVLEGDRTAPGLPVPADAEGPVVDWVWLLHDDCAPEPEALRRLLAAVDSSPSVALVGPKVVGWADPRHLLEVGVTIARSGARDTGLERHEQDQGQHDAVRSVLAVSTVGMLVRRDVWDELGGLDPALPLFRDDIDFGWRVNAAGHRVIVAPDAVVHHAEAASHRRRRIAVGPDQPHRMDRQHAMQVLLAHLPAWLLPWTVLRLTVGTLLRSVGFLVGKDPGFALAEIRALGATAAHPRTLLSMRRARRATRTIPYRDVKGLLSAPGTQLRHGVEIVGSAFGGGGSDARRPSQIVRAPSESSGGEFDEDGPGDLLAGADGVLRRTLRRPGVVLVLVMLAIALVAERSLIGGGVLLGGTLLPATDGASDLWATYTAWWHPVGVGSPAPADAYAPIVAFFSLLLLGKVTLLVDILLLLAVPLAAATAFVSLRGLVRSATLRLWAAAAYAVLPAATGAVASGRLGTALLLVLLPLLARPALRLAGVITPEPTWRTAWGTGLFVALLAAFVPGLWVLALVLAVVAAATSARSRAYWLRLGAALAVAPAVLMPWTWELVRNPSYLLVEAGVPSAAVAPDDPNPLLALMLAPGGPGTPASWVGLGIVLAAVAAVLRGVRSRAATVACVVLLTALAFALVLARSEVRTPQLSSAVPAWSGAFLVVAGAAAIVAALLAAEGARDVLTGRSFGWRQPVTLVVVALCVLGPVVAAVSWIARGAEDPVRRGEASVLPAFVVADTESPARARTLALRSDGPGAVAFSLIRADGVRLGDAEAAPAASATPQLAETVSGLASGRGGVSGRALIPYGVRYVVLDASGSDVVLEDGERTDLVRSLDAAAGLRRLSAGSGEAVWRVVGVTGRARLIPTSGTPSLVGSSEVGINTPLPGGWTGGVLALADAHDAGWKATLDGRQLEPTTVGGWAQGFVVPAGSGRISLTYEQPSRTGWLIGQLVVVVVVIVLALPSRRRDGEGEDA